MLRFSLCCLLLLVLTGAAPLAAKTINIDADKCHVDVPDDWKQVTNPGNKLAAQSPDQNKAVILRIVDVGPNFGIDDAGFANGLEKSVTANGATITGRSKGTFAGFESRVWDATQPAPSGTAYTHMIVVMANGKAYGLVLQKLGGKPEDDDQLKGMAESFGFIGTPEPQHPVDPNDARAKKYGEIVGVFLAVVAAFATMRWLARLRNRKT